MRMRRTARPSAGAAPRHARRGIELGHELSCAVAGARQLSSRIVRRVAGSIDESLLNAAAQNHRVWFRRSAAAEGCTVVDAGGTQLCLGREAMVFPESGLDVDALMAEIRARECGSVGCWSLSANAALGTRLLARGFGWGWRPHWMAIDLDDAFGGAPARFSVVPAAPPYARTLPYAPSGPEPEGSFRLGVRLTDKVVGQVVINPWDGVAGIYSMGVAPRVRRRGIGAALTEAACRVAVEHGCRHAVLNATDAGDALYRQAGFRSLGWGQTWWYSPGPEPTTRQIALTEAVGFGDLATLAALRPTPDEMADPLPGGESPLTLTVLTDQPAVAGYLLERCPDLVNRRFAPHGATLLHLAIEHDRPAFVEVALAHGVDPEARDGTFNATAAGWAEHFAHREILQRLARIPKR
jgi:ribosomal protein S18 acetylase RimI-like enzyme